MDILFKNATVVTMDEDKVLHNALVGVKDGKIAYLEGFPAEAKKEQSTESQAVPESKRVIDCKHKVLMPGLINCHAHSPMSLLRGFAGDLNLQDWLFDHIFPAEKKMNGEDVYKGALLTIAEMIASGTVSMTDMYFSLDSVAKAVFDSGFKANLSNAAISFEPETYRYQEDKVFTETMLVLENFQKQSQGRIKAEASIHAEYTSFPGLWTQVLDFAKAHSLAMHIHLSETKFEHEQCKGKYGLTPAQIFDKYDLFSVPVLAAHGVWLEEEDMDLLAGRATVAHNPVSNLKLASGIAPVTRMIQKGVNVALGTDGVASNNSHDLFEEIKLASILQKAATANPTVLPAKEVLRMATINGAKAQGRDNCGAVKLGYDADLILLDFDNERLTPCYDPISGIVYSATGQDVVLTLCQGKILYENGEHKTIDLEKLLHEVRSIVTKF